jgi:hypothetical protein
MPEFFFDHGIRIAAIGTRSAHHPAESLRRCVRHRTVGIFYKYQAKTPCKARRRAAMRSQVLVNKQLFIYLKKVARRMHCVDQHGVTPFADAHPIHLRDTTRALPGTDLVFSLEEYV